MSPLNFATWLVPDPLGRPGDPFLERVEVPCTTIDDSIYYWPTTADGIAVEHIWWVGSSAVGEVGLVINVAAGAIARSAQSQAVVDGAALVG
jgi:hypothetical protein